MTDITLMQNYSFILTTNILRISWKKNIEKELRT